MSVGFLGMASLCPFPYQLWSLGNAQWIERWSLTGTFPDLRHEVQLASDLLGSKPSAVYRFWTVSLTTGFGWKP